MSYIHVGSVGRACALWASYAARLSVFVSVLSVIGRDAPLGADA